MKLRELLLSTSLVLVSPLLFAQTPATPAAPATPAVPAEPGTDTDKDKPPPASVQPPDDTGMTRGAVHTPSNGRANAAANPNSGHASGSVAGKSDFGTLDADGDGRLTKDELRGDASISGRFKELDKNSDGKLSRAEYQNALRAAPGG